MFAVKRYNNGYSYGLQQDGRRRAYFGQGHTKSQGKASIQSLNVSPSVSEDSRRQEHGAYSQLIHNELPTSRQLRKSIRCWKQQEATANDRRREESPWRISSTK